MTLKYEAKIPVDENIVIIREVYGVIQNITNSLKSYYEFKYNMYSPYYSGHGWSDDREETSCYEFTKNEVKKGFLEIHREQRDLLYPTKDFPSGIADVNIRVILELEDQEDKNLADSLKNLFGRLENIISSK